MTPAEFDKIPSCFIAIEGGDACGKATQSKLLFTKILALWDQTLGNRPAPLFLSFPRYDTPLGKAIERHLRKQTQLVEFGTTDLYGKLEPLAPPSGVYFDTDTQDAKPLFKRAAEDALAFQCMMQVDRDLAGSQIKNHLERGGHVVADRWNKSGFVYGVMDGGDADVLRHMGECLPQPDLHILLDVSVDVAMARRPVPRDRYESSVNKRELVRKLYLGLWKENAEREPYRWVIVDGNQAVDVVADYIWNRVLRLFHGKELRL
jgi:thymidylate kinase